METNTKYPLQDKLPACFYTYNKDSESWTSSQSTQWGNNKQQYTSLDPHKHLRGCYHYLVSRAVNQRLKPNFDS